MPNARVSVTVVTVCLPSDTPTDHLATAATARLAATPLTSAGPAGQPRRLCLRQPGSSSDPLAPWSRDCRIRMARCRTLCAEGLAS